MKILRKFIFDIIRKLTKEHTRNHLPSCGELSKEVAKTYGIVDNRALSDTMKYELKQYKRNRECDDTVVVIDSEEEKCNVDWSSENIDLNTRQEPPRRNRKSFGDYTANYRLAKTDEIYKKISAFVDEELNSGSENKVTVTRFMGYLLHRSSFMKNKKISDIGMEIFREGKIKNVSFDVSEAVALMHELTLTKYQIIKLKAYLTSKGVYFPNQKELVKHRKTLRPVIRIELGGDGVSVNYTELFHTTTKAIIEMIKQKGIVLDPLKEIKAVYKDGGDGSGSQTIWKSASMINASDHIFQYSMVPVRIEQDGVTIWKNPSPNSATSTRPIFLLRAGESEERVKDLVIKKTDEGRKDLEVARIIKTDDESVFCVRHEIIDSMKDMKLKKEWSGLGGADCILCESKKADWKNVTKIEEGFPITRLAEDTKKLWTELSMNGEITRKSGDYESRKGLTNNPLTDSDQHHICVTHSYINVMSWFLKVLYRCNISFESWVEKSTVLGEPIRKAKVRVQNKLESVGIIVDRVSGANSKGGTSNDGNTARKFFTETYVDLIADCVDEKYKTVIRNLHKNLSCILRLVSSTEQIDHEKYSSLCKETALMIANELLWVDQNYTLHGVLSHSSELIYLNDGWSIGMFSEEPLESNNKFIRHYLERYARLSSPILQLTDVMSRLLERSHPSVIQKQKHILSETKRTCEECNGNHKTTNHQKYVDHSKKLCLSEYDSFVQSFILPGI